MQKAVLAAGSVVVAAAIGTAAYFYAQNVRLSERVARLEAAPPTTTPVSGEAQAVEARLTEAQARAASLETDLDAARAQIAELEDRLAKAEEAAPTPKPEATSPPPQDVQDAKADARKASLEEFRRQFQNNPAVSAQVRGLMELSYADVLNQLPPDLRSAVRELLLESQMEQMALARYAIELGDVTYREYNQWSREETGRLAEQLKELMTPQEFAQWEQHIAQAEARLLDATFENQLRAFASGLTPESHELIRQVAVEEFMAEQERLRNSEVLYTAEESILYQLRAMEHMRERLAPVLPADQFQELENWFRMGENVLRANLPQRQGPPAQK